MPQPITLQSLQSYKTHFHFDLPYPTKFKQALDAIAAHGGISFIVGGVPRDLVYTALTKISTVQKDFDVEVYNIPLLQLKEILSGISSTTLQPKPYPVCKFFYKKHTEPVDFAIPRVDIQQDVGHNCNMDVVPNVYMHPCQAVQRRDLTVNAAMLHYPSGIIYDFSRRFIHDITNRIADCVSPTNFSDDLLRCYRVAQISARLDLTIAQRLYTIAYDKRKYAKLMTPARTVQEILKLVFKGRNIATGLTYLVETQWIDAINIGSHGPLVDVKYWKENHIIHHISSMTRIADANQVSAEIRGYMVLAMMSYNIPNPMSAYMGIQFSKHDAMTVQNIITSIHALRNATSSYDVRKVAAKSVINIPLLITLIQPFIPQSEYTKLRYLQQNTNTTNTTPLLIGRDLVPRYMRGGPLVGQILREAYDLQLHEALTTKQQAIEWAIKQYHLST